MGKSDHGNVHCSALATPCNSLLSLRESTNAKVAILATGSMVKTAMNLVDDGYISASVWSIPSLKPMNIEQVIDICRGNELIITLEEHSIFGGMGSAITEISSEYAPVKIKRIGVQDRFSHYCGTYEYLLNEHKLDIESIKSQIKLL